MAEPGFEPRHQPEHPPGSQGTHKAEVLFVNLLLVAVGAGMRASPATASARCQDLKLVWKAEKSRSTQAAGLEMLRAVRCCVFTGSERGSEVNTRVGSQSPGLRGEEIHLQYKLETSVYEEPIWRGLLIPPPTCIPRSSASGLSTRCQTERPESSEKFTFSPPSNTNWP